MKFISRRSFLTVLLATGVAGLAAGCGADSSSIIGTPVEEPEHILVGGADAASIAEAATDVAFIDLTGPTRELMDTHEFNSPGWNAAILEYLEAYPGGPGEMALMTYHFGAQNSGRYPERPTATAMTAQQAANHAARLLRVMHPDQTWDYCYTICERQDGTGTRHQQWQVILTRQHQPDRMEWFHLYLDAVTGALYGYLHSSLASGDYPETQQEQQTTMAALQQMLDAVLDAAGAGQTVEGLRIDSANVDSIHLTFCYACDIDDQFYTVSCERDGSLLRLWPGSEE